MIKELLYRWFDIQPLPCPTCEVLQIQLETEQRRNEKLLDKLLNKEVPITPIESPDIDDMKPVGPKFIPWRVRQAQLESEDRAAAKVLREKREEIELAKKQVTNSKTPQETQNSISKLEQELGITGASK